MTNSIAVPLSEAKTNLSSIIKDIRDTGAEYTVLLRNVPVATISPIPFEASSKTRTRGLLAKYADHELRSKEKDAFGSAMRSKHAHTA